LALVALMSFLHLAPLGTMVRVRFLVLSQLSVVVAVGRTLQLLLSLAVPVVVVVI
jgi:hypothetical protein